MDIGGGDERNIGFGVEAPRRELAEQFVHLFEFVGRNGGHLFEFERILIAFDDNRTAIARQQRAMQLRERISRLQHAFYVGSHLGERPQHELSREHVGMRDRQAGHIDLQVTILQNVDVDGAVEVHAVLAFHLASQRFLEHLRLANDLCRMHSRFKDGNGVEKFVVGVHVHRIRLNQRRSAHQRTDER